MRHSADRKAIEAIVAKCATALGVDLHRMRAGWRNPNAVAARAAAVVLLREELRLGKPAVGRALGLSTSQVDYWLRPEDWRVRKRAKLLARGNQRNRFRREQRDAGGPAHIGV